MFGKSDKTPAAASPEVAATSLSPAEQAKADRAALIAKIEERKRRLSNPSGLVQVFEENEVSATADFKGKQVIVEGTIDNIGLDIMDNPYVTLGPGDGIRSVQCTFEDKSAVAKLHKGDQITIQGICKGLMMNVLLDDCEEVESLASMRKRLKALPK